MKTFKIILVLFCILCSSVVFAQKKVKDKESKSVRIPAEPSKKKKDSALVKIKVAPKPIKEADKKSEDTNNEKKKFVIKESEKPFSMIDDDGLKSPSEIYEKRWKKEAAKGGIIKTMSDQFLGEHRVDTKFVNIVCRDHEYPDGDRVQIMLNGYIVKHNLLLKSNYRRVEVNLAEGKNTVDIIALNQGESGPNTAEFIVYDDKGKVISSKEWNLLTGVKATIIFHNEKVVIKEKTAKEEDKDDSASNN
ncbi:hypothetical protein H8K90_08325 [Winogradskyella echinorum]|uniref:Uncharacterized protein n=1 Tax=Winogradskyella echinorum TaxID=538189 RepID=A0ABR6Y0W8_9FLAO|nr:hypothetical protein [Winogradskyella echinorum]MBC3846382.1 hypothetical protein [Winogradskyella echinorum]MBC5750730.1 hypothetical protein [Winogradskyella echinorum]